MKKKEPISWALDRNALLKKLKKLQERKETTLCQSPTPKGRRLVTEETKNV